MDNHVATIGTSCLNCGAALDGPFCSQCGQKAVHPKPSLHDLLHDALEEFLHFDGKIVQTLKMLVTHPGQLTVDIVAGRRARYIAPLRLYLTVSLIFFLVATYSPRTTIVTRSEKKSGGITFSPDSTARVGRELTEEEKQQLLEAADKNGPRILRPLVHRAIEDPVGLQRDVFAAWPKALFALLPVFAVFVALFYHRRHFVEHLYFALHVHAFAFLVMAVNSAIGMAHLSWLSLVSGFAVLIWIPIYVHLAFVRVYRENHVLTMVKETGVGLLYTMASIPAIFIAALWAASHPH